MSSMEKILASAEKLFAEQGFDSTTMDQVAQEAGLTKGAVYYFFKNKADVFCRMVDPGLQYLEEQGRKVIGEGREGDEMTRDLIGCIMDLVYDNDKIVRILLGSQTADPTVRRLFDQRINRLMHWIEKILYEGVASNFLKPISITLYAKLIVGMIYGMIALPDPPERDAAARAVQNMLRTIYR